MSVYYVWTKDGRNPTKMHRCVENANVEADRLASMNKGITFTVLKTCNSYTYDVGPTFGSLDVGDRFNHSGRLLVKTDRLKITDEHGETRMYNAVRIAPNSVAGRHSTFRDSTTVEV